MVTTNSYDAANRLTARSRSDGHAYTYDWSQRGQLLTEWTQGYPVRAFAYDGTGRMIQANERTAYQHELAHALIDGYRLAPWGNDPHHRLMCRCGLPVAASVCAGLREENDTDD